MRNFLMSAMALTAVLVVPSVASADSVSDRSEAIRLCRAEVSAQAVGAEVRLDQVLQRGRSVKVDLDVWRDGQLQNVRCDVSTAGGQVAIASITPALQTAAAAVPAAQ